MPDLVDGVAAANTLLTFTGITPGYCLKYVWQAYQAHGAVSDGKPYPTAWSAWQQSAHQVPGDRDVPAGFPAYLGPRSGSSAGDVIISMGGGQFAATDWPSNGRTGVCTLSQREAQTGRPYAGWTRDILGQGIDGDDMNKQDVKDAMLEFYRDVSTPPDGLASWPFFDRAVWGAPLPAQTPEGTTQKNPDGTPVTFAARGYLASTNTAVHGIQVPPVDYDALAKSLSAQGGDGGLYPARVRPRPGGASR